MELRLSLRCDGLLEAYDNETIDVLKSYPPGQYMPVEWKPNRTIENHRRWFAFVKHTFSLQDMYDDITTWRGILQIYGGHCKTVVDAKGNTHIWPESIAWASMNDETKFKAMFRKSLKNFIVRHCQGATLDEILQVMSFEPFMHDEICNVVQAGA